MTQYDAVAAIANSPSALIVANDIPAATVSELVAYRANGAGKNELCVGRHRQRLASELRGVQGCGGHGGRPHTLQGRRPSHRGHCRRPCPDDDHVGSGTKSLVEAGKIKALAVTSAARSPAMPSVPTMQEAGVKSASMWSCASGSEFSVPRACRTPSRQSWKRPSQRSCPTRASATGWPSWTSRRTSRPAPALRTRLETEIKNWTRFIEEKGIRPE